MQAATQDFLAAAVLEGLQEVTEGLERIDSAITLLADATGQGLGHLAAEAHDHMED